MEFDRSLCDISNSDALAQKKFMLPGVWLEGDCKYMDECLRRFLKTTVHKNVGEDVAEKHPMAFIFDRTLESLTFFPKMRQIALELYGVLMNEKPDTLLHIAKYHIQTLQSQLPFYYMGFFTWLTADIMYDKRVGMVLHFDLVSAGSEAGQMRFSEFIDLTCFDPHKHFANCEKDSNMCDTVDGLVTNWAMHYRFQEYVQLHGEFYDRKMSTLLPDKPQTFPLWEVAHAMCVDIDEKRSTVSVEDVCDQDSELDDLSKTTQFMSWLLNHCELCE